MSSRRRGLVCNASPLDTSTMSENDSSMVQTNTENKTDTSMPPSGTPMSRRSGRQRVFNSRYKDMEVKLTSRRQTGKLKTELSGRTETEPKKKTCIGASSERLEQTDEVTVPNLGTEPKKRKSKSGASLSKAKRHCRDDATPIKSCAAKESCDGVSDEGAVSGSGTRKLNSQIKTDMITTKQGSKTSKSTNQTSNNISVDPDSANILSVQKQSRCDSPVGTGRIVHDDTETRSSRLELSPPSSVTESLSESLSSSKHRNKNTKPQSSTASQERNAADSVTCSVKVGATLSETTSPQPKQAASTLKSSRDDSRSSTESKELPTSDNITMDDADSMKVLESGDVNPGIPDSDMEQVTAVQVSQSHNTDSSNKVFVDMDTGEHKYMSAAQQAETSGVDCWEHSGSGDESSGGDESGEQSKQEVGETKEQVKVMEDEMMSLLNLFLTDVDDKKENSSSPSQEEGETDGAVDGPVMVDGADELTACTEEALPTVTEVVVTVMDSENNSKVQADAANSADAVSKVNVLPMGSTVYLLNEQAMQGVDNVLDDGAEGGEITLGTAPPGTDVEDVKPVIKDPPYDATKELHIVIKGSKDKVPLDHDGVSVCSWCGFRREVGSNVKHACTRRPKDEFLHMDGDLYTCVKCEYRTDKKINWYKHKIKHQERRYQCTQCDYKASTSSNLKRHVMSHSDVRNFGCNICWATFPQKIHLQRHIKYKHEVVPHTVQCSYCDYVCAEVQPDLVTHMKRKHPELCSLDKDGNPIKGSEGGVLDAFMRFKCDHCNLYAVSRKDLQQHLKFHKKGSELKFFCELCSFVTECESRLKRHMLTHTKEKPYGCSMCNYRGSLPEHVKRHLKTKHKVEVSYSRKRLGAGGEGSASILMERAPRLKLPTQTDTRNSEKHFACNFCTMKFSKLISLFKHVHVQHSQLMPQDNHYSCVVCDYTTMHYKRLLLHMRKMHSTTNCMNTPQQQVYVCMSCKYTTPYRLFLHAHLKKEHNMQVVTDKYLMDASRHSSTMVETADESDTKKPGSIIKPSATVRMSAQDNPNPSKDSKMVLLQLTPDGPMTPVVINMGDTETSNSESLLNGADPETEYPIMETGINEGSPLSMQCEVIFDDDLSQVLQDAPNSLHAETSSDTTTAEAPNTNTDASNITTNAANTTNATADPPNTTSDVQVHIPAQDLSEVIQQITEAVESEPSSRESSPHKSTRHKQDEAASDDDNTGGDTSADPQGEESEHVVHLSSGDFVEINGQIYKIEMESSQD